MDEAPGQRWYEGGLRFRCTACGECCRQHGEYAYVYLREPEAEAIAAHLGLSVADFLARHCQHEDGWITLRMDQPQCAFLGPDARCGIYPVRPVQCRTWPFWEHTLRQPVWEREVRPICPGSGDGALHTAAEVEAIARATEEWYEGEAPHWDGPEPHG